jgi:hypothetical protein
MSKYTQFELFLNSLGEYSRVYSFEALYEFCEKEWNEFVDQLNNVNVNDYEYDDLYNPLNKNNAYDIYNTSNVSIPIAKLIAKNEFDEKLNKSTNTFLDKIFSFHLFETKDFLREINKFISDLILEKCFHRKESIVHFNFPYQVSSKHNQCKKRLLRDEFANVNLSFKEIFMIDGLSDKLNFDYLHDILYNNYQEIISYTKNINRTNKTIILIEVFKTENNQTVYQVDQSIIYKYNKFIIELQKFFYNNYHQMIIDNLMKQILRVQIENHSKGKDIESYVLTYGCSDKLNNFTEKSFDILTHITVVL